MVEQYEKELEYLVSTDNKVQLVMCPICQVSQLNLNGGILKCSCGFE